MKTPQIYALIDPITNDIRYIGKTVSTLSKRLSAHYNDKNITYKTNWINSLKEKKLKPIIQNIEFCEEYKLNEKEIYWISFFSEKYNLTNLTKGGDGLPIGFRHSEETKNKISISSKKINSGNFKKGHKPINKELAIENIKKKILVYDLDGKFITEIKGINEASKILKVNKTNITDCLKNRISHIRNFRFYYYIENFNINIESIKNDVILRNRKIYEYENNIFIREYQNAKEASKYLNIKYKTLNNILIGKTKKCKEYPNKFWKYN